MAKEKQLLEKIWWVIPPVVVILLTSLQRAVEAMRYFNRPLSSFASTFVHSFLEVFGFGRQIGGDWVFNPSLWDMGALSLTGIFMGIAYYSSRNRSMSIRIIIPTIIGFFGYYISLLIVFIIAGLTGKFV